MENNTLSSRRLFMQSLAVGATTLYAGSVSGGGMVPSSNLAGSADEWFKKIRGKHRIVYDASEPHHGFAIIWSWVFMTTNNQTGSKDDDLTAMVVLRHNAIPFAMEDGLWKKYSFGEVFKVDDPKTMKPSLRNPYWVPQEGDFPVKDIQGIKDLQARGSMFCVCDMALTVYSSMIAQQQKLNPEEVKKDWVSGLLPDVQVVPSGVWAIGRAQENGCAYCYAGG